MKTYLENSLHLMPPKEIMLFRRIEMIIDALPDIIDLGEKNGEPIIMSCHMLARAASKVFNLKYVDGHYHLDHFAHSWLVTPMGNIIDLYPVATIGGPLLVLCCREFLTPGRQFYVPRSARFTSKGIGFGQPWFRRAVRILIRELKKAAAECGCSFLL